MVQAPPAAPTFASLPDPPPDRAALALRTADFWRRASFIYAAYKGKQVQDAACRLAGWSEERLKDELWAPHHAWAGRQMYDLAVGVRGFYLKVGQFFAARSEFVPEGICKELQKLHDRVPPMPAAKARAVIEAGLGGAPLGDVFQWIDLDAPLGSASVAQVHKARLRGAASKRTFWGGVARCRLSPLRRWMRSRDARRAPPPGVEKLAPSDDGAATALAAAAALAAVSLDPSSSPSPDGLVAVKVQYPGAAALMAHDITHVRTWARFLSKTEIAFDLVSAVDELDGQVALEFDFEREARVMDAIASHLADMRDEVEVPRSIPGLVSRRVLTMGFIDGESITRAASRASALRAPAAARRAAAKRILSRVCKAYGRMILGEGLFQADSHPGNIFVKRGGRVALLDYGQSKQLPEEDRLAFARLVLRMEKGYDKADPVATADALHALGLRFSKDDPHVLRKMAYGMFDTRTSFKVDPFAADSPIKTVSIDRFPPDVFFVLRVVQMLRGLAGGMGVRDFSCTEQWAPFARAALAAGARERSGPCVTAATADWGTVVGAAPEHVRELVAGEGGGEGGSDDDAPSSSSSPFATAAFDGLQLVPIEDGGDQSPAPPPGAPPPTLH